MSNYSKFKKDSKPLTKDIKDFSSEIFLFLM